MVAVVGGTLRGEKTVSVGRRLVARGRWLAKQGQRRKARNCFARALAIAPADVDALLWLAALADDPQESIHYLKRVLTIEPDNEAAHAGLRWAHDRLHAGRSVVRSRVPAVWLDALLMGGIALALIAACLVLSFMAWQTPEAVRAAYRPTVTMTATATPLPTPTQTSTPTPTIAVTLSPTPAVSFTLSPSRVPSPTATSLPVPVAATPSPVAQQGIKWIDLDLSRQLLVAYEGQTPVFRAWVSTGVARYPTPVGEFAIYRKVRVQDMRGPGYYLPNVEFVSYFYKGYAIHGTYWHNNFGQPMSHGCVNMRNADAAWIYNWASIGTRVRIHH